MQGHHDMPSQLPPRQTHITDDADETTAWNKDAKTLLPDAVELVKELFVILNIAELPC
jgi:hypothetical protein